MCTSFHLPPLCFYLFLFSDGTGGVEHRNFNLLGRCCPAWTTLPANFFFPFVISRVLLYAWASVDHDPSIWAPQCNWDKRWTPPHPVIGWDGMSGIFSLDWPQTAILLISACQEARITGLSHHASPTSCFDLWPWPPFPSGCQDPRTQAPLTLTFLVSPSDLLGPLSSLLMALVVRGREVRLL
jgi:hypothetical protein